TEGLAFIQNNVMGSGDDLFNTTSYFIGALPGHPNDFKERGMTEGMRSNYRTADAYRYRGGYLGTRNGNPVFASARDIGNIGAGYKAGQFGLPWSLTRFGFDVLQNWKHPWAWETEGAPTSAAEKLGFGFGQTGKWDINLNGDQ